LASQHLQVAGEEARINFEPMLAKENEQRCLKAWPDSSHFVAALAQHDSVI
jgi:hypothetical protein